MADPRSILLHIDSGQPVLVLPFAGDVVPVPRLVTIAWKETREAARAVVAALPWLRRAQLAAHGVSHVQDSNRPASGDAGELLLSHAADIGAELLVMGCCGHRRARAREWVLGGASRTPLRSMTLPVLMVH